MQISQALGKGRKKWEITTRRDKLITGFWLRNLGDDKRILKVDKDIRKLCCWKEEQVRHQICDEMMGLKARIAGEGKVKSFGDLRRIQRLREDTNGNRQV